MRECAACAVDGLFVYIISNLMLIVTIVEVADHYQDNIVYQGNLMNIIKVILSYYCMATTYNKRS